MIAVDPSLPVPVYEQLIAQVKALRGSAALPANHRLPTVRQMAAELGLAPNTVARAYRELESAGVIETRGRHGSFVTGTVGSIDKAARAAAADYAATVRELGLGPDAALAIVREALDRG